MTVSKLTSGRLISVSTDGVVQLSGKSKQYQAGTKRAETYRNRQEVCFSKKVTLSIVFLRVTLVQVEALFVWSNISSQCHSEHC